MSKIIDSQTNGEVIVNLVEVKPRCSKNDPYRGKYRKLKFRLEIYLLNHTSPTNYRQDFNKKPDHITPCIYYFPDHNQLSIIAGIIYSLYPRVSKKTINSIFLDFETDGKKRNRLVRDASYITTCPFPSQGDAWSNPILTHVCYDG